MITDREMQQNQLIYNLRQELASRDERIAALEAQLEENDRQDTAAVEMINQTKAALDKLAGELTECRDALTRLQGQLGG